MAMNIGGQFNVSNRCDVHNLNSGHVWNLFLALAGKFVAKLEKNFAVLLLRNLKNDSSLQ